MRCEQQIRQNFVDHEAEYSQYHKLEDGVGVIDTIEVLRWKQKFWSSAERSETARAKRVGSEASTFSLLFSRAKVGPKPPSFRGATSGSASRPR